MKRKIFSALKYLVSLAIAIALLFYVFRDWEFNELLSRFREVNYFWVAVSLFFSILSHILRAYRWNLLLYPLGYTNLSTYRTFKAVMIGYLANLVAPRLGEITRCGVMKREDNVNMSASIGTVVAERVFDILMLFVLIIIGLITEFDKLSGFFVDFFNARTEGLEVSQSSFNLFVIIGFILVILLLLLWWFRERVKRKPIYYKVRSFIREMLDGFTSVLRLKNKKGFWTSTILIWVLYFVMAFVLFYSIDSTSHLGFAAGLSVLIMGGIGMSAPVQGGFGVYHILVGSILMTYGIAEKDGYFFATLVHSSQTLMVMIIGGISLVLTLPSKNKEENNKVN